MHFGREEGDEGLLSRLIGEYITVLLTRAVTIFSNKVISYLHSSEFKIVTGGVCSVETLY